MVSPTTEAKWFCTNACTIFSSFTIFSICTILRMLFAGDGTAEEAIPNLYSAWVCKEGRGAATHELKKTSKKSGIFQVT